mmetsp:Transcript_48592/g.105805  ORF Transcript_48592/g.105805 Transcript_48592/m.105805 type:complete len:113 (+) Transcript_48592:114-452(+)
MPSKHATGRIGIKTFVPFSALQSILHRQAMQTDLDDFMAETDKAEPKFLKVRFFFRFLLLALFAGVRGNKLIHDKHQLLRVHPVTHSLIEGVVAHVDFDLSQILHINHKGLK